MDAALQQAENAYFGAAQRVSSAITSKHAPKIALGAMIGYGLYKLAFADRLPTETVADVTTSLSPPGAALGGSLIPQVICSSTSGDVDIDEVPGLVRLAKFRERSL